MGKTAERLVIILLLAHCSSASTPMHVVSVYCSCVFPNCMPGICISVEQQSLRLRSSILCCAILEFAPCPPTGAKCLSLRDLPFLLPPSSLPSPSELPGPELERRHKAMLDDSKTLVQQTQTALKDLRKAVQSATKGGATVSDCA